MREIIHRLHTILNQMKGFTPGTTSRVPDKMLLEYEGRRFILSLEEIENPDEDIFKDMDRYLI